MKSNEPCRKYCDKSDTCESIDKKLIAIWNDEFPEDKIYKLEDLDRIDRKCCSTCKYQNKIRTGICESPKGACKNLCDGYPNYKPIKNIER